MPQGRGELSLKEIREKYATPGAVAPQGILRRLARDPRAGARQLHRVLSRRSEDDARERKRLDAMLHFERVLWKAGVIHIAGVDEVGVGPLAGPVIAAAVIFPPDTEIDGVDDSKALDEETRERLSEEICRKASAWAIGRVDVDEIDRLNIYHAGIHAMWLAIAALPIAPQHVLVDSRTIPNLTVPQNSFDQGDGMDFSIAAASIVAKVHRDALMREMDAVYPGYGFAVHKGYATPEHRRAIRSLGPCPIHRRSFDYIREIQGEYSNLYYTLKDEGSRILLRTEILRWEIAVKEAKPSLSPNEHKKLQLQARRIWAKVAH
jgi:ribonuclease HII